MGTLRASSRTRGGMCFLGVVIDLRAFKQFVAGAFAVVGPLALARWIGIVRPADAPNAQEAQVLQNQVQMLLAEYSYVGQHQRDEVSRLNQIWLALGALVTVTVLFYSNDVGEGNLAMIAPFGVVAWWLLQLRTLTGLYVRAFYLAEVELRANELLGTPALKFETRGIARWPPISGKSSFSPWFLSFVTFSMLPIALYVAFSIVTWGRLSSARIERLFLVLLVVGAIAALGVALYTVRAIREAREAYEREVQEKSG